MSREVGRAAGIRERLKIMSFKATVNRLRVSFLRPPVLLPLAI